MVSQGILQVVLSLTTTHCTNDHCHITFMGCRVKKIKRSNYIMSTYTSPTWVSHTFYTANREIILKLLESVTDQEDKTPTPDQNTFWLSSSTYKTVCHSRISVFPRCNHWREPWTKENVILYLVFLWAKKLDLDDVILKPFPNRLGFTIVGQR